MRKFMIKRMWLALVAILLGVGIPDPAYAEICEMGTFKMTFEYEGCSFGATCSGDACRGTETGTLYIIEDSVKCSCNGAA